MLRGDFFFHGNLNNFHFHLNKARSTQKTKTTLSFGTLNISRYPGVGGVWEWVSGGLHNRTFDEISLNVFMFLLSPRLVLDLIGQNDSEVILLV